MTESIPTVSKGATVPASSGLGQKQPNNAGEKPKPKSVPMKPDQFNRSAQTRLPNDMSCYETPEGVKALTDGNATARVEIVKKRMKSNMVDGLKLARVHLKSTKEILLVLESPEHTKWIVKGFQYSEPSFTKSVRELLYQAARLAKTQDEARVVAETARRVLGEYLQTGDQGSFERLLNYAENLSLPKFADQCKFTRTEQTRLTERVKRAKNATARVEIVKEVMKGNMVFGLRLARAHLKSTEEILLILKGSEHTQKMIISRLKFEDVKYVVGLLDSAARLAKTPDEARVVAKTAQNLSYYFKARHWEKPFEKVGQLAEDFSEKLTHRQLTQQLLGVS
jgi:hypothetical protein